MSVYGTSADTILHCYCLDEEINASPINAKRTIHDFMKLNVSDREGLLRGQNSSSAAQNI